MRIGWLLLWMLLVALPVVAVDYAVGLPITLTTNISSNKVGPGELVRVRLSATDIDYDMGPNMTVRQQIQDPVTLSWDVTGGTVQKTSISANPVDLTWRAPLQSGYYIMYVTAADSGRFIPDAPARAMLEICVTRAGEASPLPAVRITATPSIIRLDHRRTDTATITAQLLGKQDLGGKTITFYSTIGKLSATQATTNANGNASVTLTVDRDCLGMGNVAVSYGNSTSSTTVSVVERVNETNQVPNPQPPIVIPPWPNASDFAVGVEPPSLPADGKSTATVTVRLTDLRGVGMARQPVAFRAVMGLIVRPNTVTDWYGYARAQLVSANTPGTDTIIAESGGKRGFATVTYTALQPTSTPQGSATRLYLTVDPSVALADGVTKIRVEALVLDQDGHAVTDTPVNFSATLGTLAKTPVLTDAGGKATTTLTASDRPGLATITARIGGTTAASQLTFQGVNAGGPGLDLRLWSGQQMTFVRERWVLRTIQVENGLQGGLTKVLCIMDGAAKIIKEIPLDLHAVLIHDQYGTTRGYTTEKDDKATLTMLQVDGIVQRVSSLVLSPGCHITDVQYADPGGQLLVSISRPDGTAPEVQLLSDQGVPVRVLRDGLEAMPVMALGGDGYLVVALPGGTVRLYAPTGALVSEVRRADGLLVKATAVAPGGEWYAVGAVPADGADGKPKLSLFSRQGTPQVTFPVEAVKLLPVRNFGILAATPDRTIYMSLATQRVEWTLIAGYERALVTGDYIVLAGLRDPQSAALLSRIIVARISDGIPVATQTLSDVSAFYAVLPPDEKGMVGVVTMPYTLRFPLPKEK